MVRIEPTAGTATSVVKLGFALFDVEPLDQDSKRKFQPEFMEIRYENDHDGKGWTWRATVRGRRINKGGRLGAADASTWFHGGRSGRYDQAMPEWVPITAEGNMPDAPALPTTHPDAYQSFKLGRPVTGTWRGRVRVTARYVSLAGDEIALETVDPEDAKLVARNRWSLLEYVPDEGNA